MDKTHGGKAMVAAAPGYVEFRLEGKTMRLYPTVQQGQLWFDFRDRTSESTTYQAGRFLTIDTVRDRVLPEGTKLDPSKPTDIVLDFNGAQNPACAYNASTSCPIAPPENHLPVAIPAGGKALQINGHEYAWKTPENNRALSVSSPSRGSAGITAGWRLLLCYSAARRRSFVAYPGREPRTALARELGISRQALNSHQ